MRITFGSVSICILISIILTAYLIFVIQFQGLNCIKGIKKIFGGIAIILLRILIPVNFPFTITIPITHIFPELTVTLSKIIGEYAKFDIVRFIWGIGAAISLVIMAAQESRFHGLLCQVSQIGPEKKCIVASFLEKYSFEKLKIVVVSSQISPGITGIFHPILIIPEYVFALSEEMQDCIVMHEYEHYKNHDIGMKYLVKILSCLYWWNPIVYILQRKINLVIELSTDSLVVSNMDMMKKIEYMQCLVSVNKICCPGSNLSNKFAKSGVPLIQSQSDLEIRIKKIMNIINKKRQKTNLYTRINTVVVITMISASLLFVPEAYGVSDEAAENSFSVTSENAYLVEDNGEYELYVDGKSVGMVSNIGEDMKNLKIYKRGEKNEK